MLHFWYSIPQWIIAVIHEVISTNSYFFIYILIELCDTIDSTRYRDTKWVSNYSKLWYRWYRLCNIAKSLMFLDHIFNWLGSNLFHRISISVHCHMLKDEVGQILQILIPKVYRDTKAMVT